MFLSFSLSRQPHQAALVGDGLRQQLGPRLAWTLPANQPSSQTPTSKGLPSALSRNTARSRREGDPSGKMCFDVQKPFHSPPRARTSAAGSPSFHGLTPGSLLGRCPVRSLHVARFQSCYPHSSAVCLSVCPSPVLYSPFLSQSPPLRILLSSWEATQSFRKIPSHVHLRRTVSALVLGLVHSVVPGLRGE